MWAFYCYTSVTGEDRIRGWYESQSTGIRAAMDAVLSDLRVTPRNWWRRRRFAELGTKKSYRGPCTGLGEIRFEDAGQNYRILGFFGPRVDLLEFTLLVPFAKDDDPTYERSCRCAQLRKTEIENETARAERCIFPP
jgi:hypothetical protein